MPFAGGAAELRRALDSLRALRLGPDDSVVLADNRPPGAGGDLPGAGPVRIVGAPERASSYHARNRGAAAGRAPWLVFLDADVTPPPDLLDRYFDAEVAPDVAVLAGGVRDRPPARASHVAAWVASRHQMDQANTLAGPWGYAQTANCAVRRAALDQVGGFCPGVRSGGDADLCFRLRAAGWRLEARPTATVDHATRTTLRGLAGQLARHGAGAAWLERRHPGSFPPRRRAGLALWLARGALDGARRAAAGSPRDAAFALLDPLTVWAFELGRLTSNRAPERSCAHAPAGLSIALLADHYPELSETFVAGEAAALSRAGHHVRVESRTRPRRLNPEAPPAVPVSYACDDRPATRLGALAWLWARNPRGCLADLAARARWRREEAPAPLRELAPVARRIAGASERHLHAHFAMGAALDALRIGRLLELPYSVTAHAFDIYLTPRLLGEKLEHAAFATSGCDYTVEDLRALVPRAADRVHRIVMGVDAERFRRRRAHADGGHVVAVGRLVEKKGFAHLVAAAALMRGRSALRRVTIVGEGPLRPALQAGIERAGLGDVVILAGALAPADVRALLEDADVLAMPSVVAADGDRDSMPVVVKEALAMELPVVASDEVGLPELVRPPWGVLVAPGDPAGLARALGEILALPVRERAIMGRAGREFVRAHCDMDAEAARLADLVRAVAAPDGGGPSRGSSRRPIPRPVAAGRARAPR